ncbi:M12 family metallopeptidase [Cryptosporangium sp. NPDC048952]|uniref:M12 family metallopeptidase n=1 Tax=Cryptosporangium sp. NPDC048952 TaxID=3363961 RepID=UPI003712F9FD
MPNPFLTRPSPRAVAGASVVALVVAAVLVGQLVGDHDPDAGPVGISIAVAVSCTALGVLILVAVPRHLVGRLLLAAGATAALGTVAVSWTEWTPVAWLSQWSWWPAYGLLFLALLVFPDGRLPGRGWRPLAIALGLFTTVGAVALAVAAYDEPRTLLSRVDEPLTPFSHLFVRIFAVALFLTILSAFGVLWALWSRWRRADSDTRQQLACLLPAVVLLLLGWGLSFFNLDGGYVLAAVAVPLGMTVAIVRYGLYDLDRVLNRTLVWLVMTALVVVGFVSIVTVLRELIMRNTSADSISLVTTGVIAIAYAPLHRRVQQGVNQLLYGDRHDPYKVIAEMGDVLGQTAEPNAVLPLLTGTIASSLQVPYVAVEVSEQQGSRLLAWYGQVGPTVQAFDMISRGEHIGRLLVSPRTDGGHFTPRETQLLADIALHAGVAVEASRLTRDLQESRERLVRAQEEERRRLRRDLHDGLGPSLTGMSMQVRAARKVAGPGRVRDILDALAGDLAACTAEVRQLVDELRPPALDRGLAVALRDECRRFDSSALSVHLDLHDDLDRLPAAVEVAAYRVVAEALNNVTRHAGARNCRVTVRRGRDLTIEVTDDGVGIAGPVRGGVGLASMRDRAGELGGECEIVPAQPTGTTVRVHFPAASLLLVEPAAPIPTPRAADAPTPTLPPRSSAPPLAAPTPVAPSGAPTPSAPDGALEPAPLGSAFAPAAPRTAPTGPSVPSAPAPAAPAAPSAPAPAAPAVPSAPAAPAGPAPVGPGGLFAPAAPGGVPAPAVPGAPAAGLGVGVRLWPGGVVPFEVAGEVGAEEHVAEAIAHLHSRTRIRFVPRASEHVDYVRFVIGESFASRVGRIGGEQLIEILAGGEMGRVLHEMVHTLGRWHEHCRTDRDEYVTIHWQNITTEARPNFLIQAVGPESGPYDYESIMHYPRVAFSLNGERTLDTVMPPPPGGLPLGQRRQLSDGDCRVLERMYQDAPAEEPAPTTAPTEVGAPTAAPTEVGAPTAASAGVGASAAAPAAAGAPAVVGAPAEAPGDVDAVTGVLRLPDDGPGGRAASVVVSVRDTTTTGGPMTPVGEVTMTNVPLSGGAGIPFRVPVTGVDPDAVYTVEAHVDVSGDGTIATGDLVTAAACPVLTGGAPTTVAVPMTSVV